MDITIILMLGYIPLIAFMLLQAIELDKFSKFVKEQNDEIKRLKPF